MKLNYCIVLLAVLFNVSSCNKQQDTEAVFKSLTVGMDVSEAEAKLGKPSSTIEQVSGSLVFWFMDDGNSIAIEVDENGKIVSTSKGKTAMP